MAMRLPLDEIEYFEENLLISIHDEVGMKEHYLSVIFRYRAYRSR